MNEKKLKEAYMRVQDDVRASDELKEKLKAIPERKQEARAPIMLRRVVAVAAAILGLLVVSNLVTLAATGEAWIGKLLVWDVNPNQPMENVRELFRNNAATFDELPGEARRDYYGGTYLDGATQVILLTDISKSDTFVDVPEYVRFEKCDYTYAELTKAIKDINDTLFGMRVRQEGFAEDVVEMGLMDRENRICVEILHMNDKKVSWFKENVSDAGYLIFENTDTLPGND